ncbi:hypothetical protein [Planktothrix agardhii]|nr:hypothetical protein [Planktothrix agardhii]CAD0219427.1 conserved hypothetical protein [Planktothrix agardhii]
MFQFLSKLDDETEQKETLKIIESLEDIMNGLKSMLMRVGQD